MPNGSRLAGYADWQAVVYPCRLVDRREPQSVEIPIPSWAPFREIVLSAWVDDRGRIHLEYA